MLSIEQWAFAMTATRAHTAEEGPRTTRTPGFPGCKSRLLAIEDGSLCEKVGFR